MSPYLSVKEVAALLNKSEKWCYEKKEHIPGFFRLAGSIFFDKNVLESKLKELATKPSRQRPSVSDRHGLA